MRATRVPAKKLEDLLVWRQAHELVLETYRVSATFPRNEIYGLTAQLRRAVISIPANIAEAFGKRGARDKARFLNIAERSLEEARYYSILARDLGYADCRSLTRGIDSVARLLHNYRTKILTPRTANP